MLELLNLLKVLRILSDGASIGAAIGGMVYFSSHPGGVGILHVLCIGGLAGRGVQGLLQYFVGPRLRRRKLRMDLDELVSLYEDGLIDKPNCQIMMDQLIMERFFGSHSWHVDSTPNTLSDERQN